MATVLTLLLLAGLFQELPASFKMWHCQLKHKFNSRLAVECDNLEGQSRQPWQHRQQTQLSHKQQAMLALSCFSPGHRGN
jgi:hypothetical protein